jgi:hypothetical protein
MASGLAAAQRNSFRRAARLVELCLNLISCTEAYPIGHGPRLITMNAKTTMTTKKTGKLRELRELRYLRDGFVKGSRAYFFTLAPVSCATADNVVWAAFSPRRKSLSEKVEKTSVTWCQ